MLESNRIYHGDCLDIMKEIDPNSIDAIITDPPYGTTACKWDTIIPFDDMWEQLKRIRKEKATIILFGSEPFSSTLRMSNIKEYKYDWYWLKTQGTGFLNSKKQPLRNIETISLFYNEQCNYYPQMGKGKAYRIKNKSNANLYGKHHEVTTNNNGFRYPLQTLEFNHERYDHPTQKPVSLMEYLIRTYTKEDDLILDFTAGSGTTGVACVNTNRKYILIEKEKKYVDIAEKRISDASQQERLFF